MGTGFSYVDDCSLFAKNLTTVVSDMMVFLGEFFTCRTEFQVSELNSLLESYFSLLLNRSQKELVNRLPDGQCLLLGSMHLVGVSAGITTASYFPQFRSCVLNLVPVPGFCGMWETVGGIFCPLSNRFIVWLLSLSRPSHSTYFLNLMEVKWLLALL